MPKPPGTLHQQGQAHSRLRSPSPLAGGRRYPPIDLQQHSEKISFILMRCTKINAQNLKCYAIEDKGDLKLRAQLPEEAHGMQTTNDAMTIQIVMILGDDDEIHSAGEDLTDNQNVGFRLKAV